MYEGLGHAIEAALDRLLILLEKSDAEEIAMVGAAREELAALRRARAAWCLAISNPSLVIMSDGIRYEAEPGRLVVVGWDAARVPRFEAEHMRAILERAGPTL